eukprot:NODE_352_length_10276_cov_0.244178.p4 type:complete len:311 gc:universal NODE_352_length_10276_cov_0.244178:1778-2710(+)
MTLSQTYAFFGLQIWTSHHMNYIFDNKFRYEENQCTEIEGLASAFKDYKFKVELKSRNSDRKNALLEKRYEKLKNYSEALETHINNINVQHRSISLTLANDNLLQSSATKICNEQAKLARCIVKKLSSLSLVLKNFMEQSESFNYDIYTTQKPIILRKPCLNEFLSFPQNLSIALLRVAKKCEKIEDHTQKINYLEKSAMLGNRLAFAELSKAYDNGLGVIQNKVVAKNWLKAQSGDSEGYYLIGNLYYCGPLQQNFYKALFWYKKAAASGNYKSLQKMAWIYGYGFGGVEKDLNLAKSLYKKSLKSDVK